MSVDEQARPALSERDFVDSIDQLRPELFRQALRRLGDPAAADDAVQETLLRAFRASDRLRPDSDLEAWTHTILRNVCRSEYARRSRDARRTARICGDPLLNRSSRPGVETELGLHESEDVGQALDELPNDYREVLELRFVDDLAYDEIADEIGVTEVNARARVSRARAAMRGALRAIAAVPIVFAGLFRRSGKKTAALEKAVGGVSSTSGSVDPSIATRIGTLAQPAVEAAHSASASASGMSAVAKAAVGVTAVATVGVGVAADPLDVVPAFDSEPVATQVVLQPETDSDSGSSPTANRPDERSFASEPAAAAVVAPAPTIAVAAPTTIAVPTTIAAIVAAEDDPPGDESAATADAEAEAAQSPVASEVDQPAGTNDAGDQTPNQPVAATPDPAPVPSTVASTVPVTTAPVVVSSAAVQLSGLSVVPAGPRIDVSGGASVDGVGGSASGRFSLEPTDSADQFRLDATIELTVAGEWIELRLAGFSTSDGTTAGAISGVFRSSSPTLPSGGDFSGSLDLANGSVSLSLSG